MSLREAGNEAGTDKGPLQGLAGSHPDYPFTLSVVAIYPHFDNNGNLTTNLQYGLDLQQGAWLQLEFKAEVVGYTTTQPFDTFVANLSKDLNTDVVQVDATHLEIRKSYTQANLSPTSNPKEGHWSLTSPVYQRTQRT